MRELRVEHVTHVYRASGVRALDGVEITIRGGESVALIGQNGSGKSTLVQHFNGLLRPTSGRVLLDGEDIRRTSVARLARLVGLAFQDPARQLFSRTVRGETEFGPRNLGRRRIELRRAVDEALDAVGLAGAADENPYDLGTAERKRLAIASVLSMQTPLTVLDEPTAGQDQRGTACIVEAIGRLRDDGRTIVAISHDMEFVGANFSRVIVMRAGRVLLDGSPSEVFAEASWPILRSTELEPPLVAEAGARLGLGSTPSEEVLRRALAARAASGRPGDSPDQ